MRAGEFYAETLDRSRPSYEDHDHGRGAPVDAVVRPSSVLPPFTSPIRHTELVVSRKMVRQLTWGGSLVEDGARDDAFDEAEAEAAAGSLRSQVPRWYAGGWEPTERIYEVADHFDNAASRMKARASAQLAKLDRGSSSDLMRRRRYEKAVKELSAHRLTVQPLRRHCH